MSLRAVEDEGARCRLCGHVEPAPLDRCPACHKHGTFRDEADEGEDDGRPVTGVPFSKVRAQRAKLIPIAKAFDGLFGGGVRKGGTYLIAGQWGAGKSSLALQLIERAPGDVLYVAAEEAPADVKERAERIGLKKTEYLFFEGARTIESVLDSEEDYTVTVYDSLHALRSLEREGRAGEAHQADHVMGLIVEHTKATAGIAFILAHHSKDGTVKGTTEGPHAVTLVSELTVDEGTGRRRFTVKKNRHGEAPVSMDLLMTARGLVPCAVEEDE